MSIYYYHTVRQLVPAEIANSSRVVSHSERYNSWHLDISSEACAFRIINPRFAYLVESVFYVAFPSGLTAIIFVTAVMILYAVPHSVL